MEILVALVAAASIAAAVAAAVVRSVRRARDRRAVAARVECPPQRYDTRAAVGSYAHATIDVEPRPHPKSDRLEDQPADWRRIMRSLGHRLTDAGIAEVTFVHGTFVGTDPFSLLGSIRELSPRVDASIVDRLGLLLKGASDRLARDRGNFHRGYVDLFGGAVDRPCSLFVWSSENSHTARLRAAVRLAHHLVAKVDALSEPNAPRLLLVGHSHAGQVFALLLQLLTDCRHAPDLVRIAGQLGEDVDWLLLHLDRLRKLQIDVVTFGTPVRYGWPARSREQLLHIVNHRGDEPTAGRLDGVPTTRDGDYIQQWGIAGSDLPATTAALRALNGQLDEQLGPGHAPRTWIELLERRKRVHDGGFTLLVDYRDASARGPNCFQTNFGHAVYTRRSNMAFWVREVVRRLG